MFVDTTKRRNDVVYPTKAPAKVADAAIAPTSAMGASPANVVEAAIAPTSIVDASPTNIDYPNKALTNVVDIPIAPTNVVVTAPTDVENGNNCLIPSSIQLILPAIDRFDPDGAVVRCESVRESLVAKYRCARNSPLSAKNGGCQFLRSFRKTLVLIVSSH